MTTIRLFCQGATARGKVDGAITAGAVGIPVEITCDDAWEGLARTMVFRTNLGREAVAGVEDTAVVPNGVLVQGLHLYLGMEGRDEEGNLVIPTNWADCGVIRSSTASEEIEYPALPGETSGSYYIPALDEEGNLTWTPSRAGMPAVAGANIKPVKGTDYWTAADQEAMVQAVLAALPAAEGVAF